MFADQILPVLGVIKRNYRFTTKMSTARVPKWSRVEWIALTQILVDKCERLRTA